VGEDEHEDDEGDSDDEVTSPVGIILSWVTMGGSSQSRLRCARCTICTADHDRATSAVVPSAFSASSQGTESPPGRGAAAERRGIGISNASTPYIVCPAMWHLKQNTGNVRILKRPTIKRHNPHQVTV
jgi:hypothetical protein